MFRLLTLFCAALTLTSCRVGNKVDGGAAKDPYSGYFETQPQSLLFCATASGNEVCASEATNKVPAQISAALTNPTAFIVRDPDTGSALFTAPDGQGLVLPVLYDIESSKLLFLGNTPAEPMFRSSACTRRLYLEETGLVTRGSGNVFPHPSGGQLRTSGRINMLVRVLYRLDGECAQELQNVASCFGDASKCGEANSGNNAELQALYQDMFTPYIDARTMTAADIPNLSTFGYEVQYE